METPKESRAAHMIGQILTVIALAVTILFAQTVVSGWNNTTHVTAVGAVVCGPGYGAPCSTPIPTTPPCGIGPGYGSPCPTPTPPCGIGPGYGSPCPTPIPTTPPCGVGPGYGSPCSTPTPFCGFGYGACGTPTPSATSTPVSAPAQLSIVPSVVSPYETFTATGTGYGPTEMVALYADNSPTPLTVQRTNSAGTFTALVTAPPAAAGGYVLRAVGAQTQRSASALIAIEPLLLIKPTSGTRATPLVVQGFGFGANETVSLSWVAPLDSLPSVQTGATGTFTIAIAIPANAILGTDVVIARGTTTHGQAVGYVSVR